MQSGDTAIVWPRDSRGMWGHRHPSQYCVSSRGAPSLLISDSRTIHDISWNNCKSVKADGKIFAEMGRSCNLQYTVSLVIPICFVTACRAPIESPLYPQPRIMVTKSIKQPSALCAYGSPHNKWPDPILGSETKLYERKSRNDRQQQIFFSKYFWILDKYFPG